MQCHLEGDAAITRPDKSLYQYRPSEDLFDFVRYYVMTDSGKPERRTATSLKA
jgi:hypothetical protein